MHGIHDCRINVHRLTAEEIVSLTSVKKKRLTRGSSKSIRFHVPWLPTTFKIKPSVINSEEVAGKRSRLENPIFTRTAIQWWNILKHNKTVEIDHRLCWKSGQNRPTMIFIRNLCKNWIRRTKVYCQLIIVRFQMRSRHLFPNGKRFLNEFQKKAAKRKKQQNAKR